MPEVKSFDRKTNFIKWLAIVTMLIDHIGAYLVPESVLLRLIGRISFPCFLYTTVQGTKRTSNFPRYIIQLLLLGFVSMPVTDQTFNILFSLALFALSMKDKRLILPCFFLSYFVEYSLYGFILGWTIYFISEENKWIGLAGFLLLQFSSFPSIQFYALLALIPIITDFRPKLIRVPKLFGYAFYPLHLWILRLLQSFLI